jgi:hypothetical protein
MQLMSDNQPAMKFINPQNVSSEELPYGLLKMLSHYLSRMAILIRLQVLIEQ